MQRHDKENKVAPETAPLGNQCSGQCYFLHLKPPGGTSYENFALVKNKLLTAGLITAESRADGRCEGVPRR